MVDTPGATVHKVSHEQGDVHAVMGDAMRFIITASESGGGYALSEIEVKPGSGAPPHIHHHEEEAFYLLQGQLTFTAQDQSQVLSGGDFLHVKRGQVRSYKNHTDQPARLLILHSPGAAAGFYIGMGQLSFPPRMEDMLALGKRFGIEVVGELA